MPVADDESDGKGIERMNCASCGKEITYGYFWEGDSVRYICTECLLSYRKKKMKIYDRKQIMEMHAKGYALRTISTVMGSNPLTIGCIIRREEKRERDEILRRRMAEAEEKD